jgi:predicted enzyme related to lactoylglutathione lyase
VKPPAAPFGHIVIPAPDLEKARRFYEGVFGWTVRRNEPGPGYWFFESGNVGGALDRDGQPAAGSVRLILRVTDMAETLERIAAHGGTVTRGREAIGEADRGYDAYFLDPNGNALGIYSDR